MLLVPREGLEQTELLPGRAGTRLGLGGWARFKEEMKGRHPKKGK